MWMEVLLGFYGEQLKANMMGGSFAKLREASSAKVGVSNDG